MKPIKRVLCALCAVLVAAVALAIAPSADTYSGEYTPLSSDTSSSMQYVDDMVYQLTDNLSRRYVFMKMNVKSHEWYYLLVSSAPRGDDDLTVTVTLEDEVIGASTYNTITIFDPVFAGQLAFDVYVIKYEAETYEKVASTATTSSSGVTYKNKLTFFTTDPMISFRCSPDIMFVAGGIKSVVQTLGEMCVKKSFDERDKYTLADIDFMLHNKDNVSSKIGSYLWYTAEEYHGMEVNYLQTKKLLTEEQLSALEQYQKGLADGRSDLNTTAKAVSDFFGSFSQGVQTVLHGISFAGISLGDIVIFGFFAFVIVILIVVVLKRGG